MASGEIQTYRCGRGSDRGVRDPDAVTTEIVRHSLNSAANQMKIAYTRTAVSPVIYEVLDFAIALFDREMRMLAQAPGLALFMGSLSFCVESAVARAGGADALEAGDILIYNWPYDTGTHPNDVALVMPVHSDDNTLIGYAAVKGHWLDVAGKEPYATDTVDVFQEGVFYPALKLYKRGQLDQELFRLVLANTRMPKPVAGDLAAQVVCVQTGARELRRLVTRFGLERFRNAVEHMYDHGETVVRQFFAKMPAGRYRASGQLDNDGLSKDPVPFDIEVEISGSTLRVDFSKVPDAQKGPINCPLPQTVSGSRVAIGMLAGGGELPNEGHFRAIEVVTRVGSLFHPEAPSPCFLCVWPSLQAIEVIYRALAEAMPEATPAGSGCDLCGFVMWGYREKSGEPWGDAQPFPIGEGGSVGADGLTTMHVSESATRLSPVEIWEAKNPWLIECLELVPDSCGAGAQRGGLGMHFRLKLLEDALVTTVFERTKMRPWGLKGGGEGEASRLIVHTPDGASASRPKATAVPLPKGSVLELFTGGGGGFGNPAERDAEKIRADLREGYLTQTYVAQHYAHALSVPAASPRSEASIR